MKLSQARIIIEAMVKSNLALAGKKARDPEYLIPYAVGGAGLGKTTLVTDICKDLRIGFQSLPLAQYDPAEIAGWLVPDDKSDRMMRKIPDWMPKEGTTGVLYLDELPQAITANQNVAAQIVNERRVGPHKIPETWTIAAAGNRSKDRAGTNHMPTHLRDRLCFLEVEADIEDTIKYFYANNVDERVCAYLRFRPDFLHQFDRDADSCPSPRSWERVSSCLRLGLNEAEEHLSIVGTLGVKAATDFRGYLKVFAAIPDMDKLIANPEQAEVPTDPGILYAVCASLAGRINDKNHKNIMTYMSRLKNQEFVAFMIRDAYAKNKTVAIMPAVSKWITSSGLLVD